MSATLLLLAVALCLAPWRGRAADRLESLLPSDGGRSGPGSPGAAGGGTGVGPPGPGSPGRVPGGVRPGRVPGRLQLHRLGLEHLRLEHLGPERLPGRPAPADPGTLARLVDLFAAALTAGLPAPDALSAVADAVGHSRPALAPPLRTVAARLRLGATPAQAWREVPGAAPLASVAAVLARATDGGGSVRAALAHASVRLRSEADAAATARAERASVLVAGPLGLCFLPAFVCLGVLPVVVGLADGMLPELGL